MCEYIINEKGHPEGFVLVIHNWIPEERQEELFRYYQNEISYLERYASYNDKLYKVPRLTCFMGDYGIFTMKEMIPWDNVTSEIRDRIKRETCISFNSAYIHKYRNGNDYIAYHRDRESSENAVIGISLGSERDFCFKEIANPKNVIKFRLKPGDCMVMYGKINELYEHSVPKRSKAEERISVTFRNL